MRGFRPGDALALEAPNGPRRAELALGRAMLVIPGRRYERADDDFPERAADLIRSKVTAAALATA